MAAASAWNILPSSYPWLLPPYDITKMDELAASGKFYSVAGLLPALGYCIFFGIARVVLTKFIFRIAFKPSTPNSDIDRAIKTLKLKKIDSTVVTAVTDSSKLPTATVAKYLSALRHNDIAEKKITKFVEAIWRFCFYLAFCILGISALFVPETVSWVLSTEDNWNNWPLQPMNDAVTLLYQIQLGSYLHQLLWTEIKRSDAAEMILHHITTITVVVFSYLTGFTRIGSSIFLVHDLADIWLEMGKCLVYISKAKGMKWVSSICDVCFAIFAATFFVTRLVIYPRYLLYSLLFEAPRIMGMWSGYYAFAGLLLTLQALHVFWFYLILKMVVRLFTTGIEKDERSDEEDFEDETKDHSSSNSSSSSSDSNNNTTTATATATATAEPSSAVKRAKAKK